jgi:propionate CoA-transferase
MTDMIADLERIALALNGVEVIDLVSFGSGISPEYLLTLLSHASLGRRQFGFVGASLPGNGWHGGLNSVITAGRAEWLIGGFFSTVRTAGLQLEAKRLSVVNFPQGILAKLLVTENRRLTSRIGKQTFIDPEARGGVMGIHKASLQWLGELAADADGAIAYSLPACQAVFLRGAGMTSCGRIVPETEPIDLDVSAVADAAQKRNTRRIFQVPAGRILERSRFSIELAADDFVFHAPPQLHSTCFFPDRYLASPSTLHSRGGQTVDRMAERLMERTLPRERLIVGIGYPVAISQRLPSELDTEINVESGNIGGTPLDGSGFGRNVDPKSRISQLQMFERIWSGDIDHAILGVGEIDVSGVINIAKLGGNLNGVGGFVDISQSLKKISFCSPSKIPIAAVNDWVCYRPDLSLDHAWIQV